MLFPLHVMLPAASLLLPSSGLASGVPAGLLVVLCGRLCMHIADSADGLGECSGGVPAATGVVGCGMLHAVAAAVA